MWHVIVTVKNFKNVGLKVSVQKIQDFGGQHLRGRTLGKKYSNFRIGASSMLWHLKSEDQCHL